MLDERSPRRLLERALVASFLRVGVGFGVGAGVFIAELPVAQAALPDTVAVVEVEDTGGALPPLARARLSTHLRSMLTQGGVTVVAVAGAGPALRAVAKAALVTTLVVVGQRYVLVAELRDLDTQAVLVRGRGQLDLPQGRADLLEPRLRIVLSSISAQLQGRLGEGELLTTTNEADDPEPNPIPDPDPQPPPQPEPVPEPEPEPEPAPTPTNHYVFQPGLDAESARFAGFAQVSLLTNRADDFYGPFQLGGWRNRAGRFVGALQFALRQNRIDDDFYGLAQVSLVSNEARDFTGLLQLGPRNSTQSLAGLGQVGLLNMVESDSYEPTSEGTPGFVGAAQIGLVNVHHKDVYTGLQLGLGHLGGRANLHAGASLGLVGLFPDGDFTGGVQASAVSVVGRDFTGLLQMGVLAGTMRTFSGVAQLGVVSYAGNNLYREIFGVHIDNGENDREDFRGLVQAGLVSLTDHDFRGVLQLGMLGNLGTNTFAFLQTGLGNYVDKDFFGFAEVGALNVVGSFSGFAQVGVVSYAAHEANGMQAGVVNLAEHVRGVQLGVVNVTDRLRGVQLGLVNFSSNGGLPVTGLVNLGF